MITITEYTKDTGKISRMISATLPETLELNKKHGFDYLIGEGYSQTQYILNEEIIERPIFTPQIDKQTILANGTDIVTISNLIGGEKSVQLIGPVSDQWVEQNTEFALTVNIQGSYTVKITKWPYQDAEVTFNAT